MTQVKFQADPIKALFPELWNAGIRNNSTAPAVNVMKTEEGYTIELAAPGLEKRDFDIKIDKNVLSVRAQKEASEAQAGAHYVRREFAYAGFERQFRLPETINTQEVKAAYTNGILSLGLQFKPEEKPAVLKVEIA